MSVLNSLFIKSLRSLHRNSNFASITQSYRNKSDDSDDCPSEAPIDLSTALATVEELQEKAKLDTKITVPLKVDLSPISGVPEEQLKNRLVRIFMPVKNAMQSGTDNTKQWHIDFDARERWENPLMGWSSTGDPLSNLHVEFSSKEEAIEHCEKYGWKWYLDTEEVSKKERVKDYGLNFHWKSRTRLSTK